ncbi:MAG: TIGR02996 domain-containing protein [Deltaproteobacteria bacterium]|nr:TIGR02996 domain-containing protein [Deltaproteobacteria bacterium]
MPDRNLELEAEIAKTPDEVAPYLVYADWLQQHGDPRGELIALSVELEHAPRRWSSMACRRGCARSSITAVDTGTSR